MSEDFQKDLRTQIEAVLFSYGDWITPGELKETLNTNSEKKIEELLNELKEKYREGFSFHIEKDDRNRWKMSLRDEYQSLVTTLISGTEIPAEALKVLSVVAYEQPITKTRISEILGKSANKEIAYLYRNKFLSYQKHGIGKYYRVTKKFYDYFNLEEDEDFRSTANKNIATFLEEFSEDSPISESEEK